MKLSVMINDDIELESEEVAKSISTLNSDDFGRFIDLVFDYMECVCKTEERMQSQLCWIANQMPDNAIKRIKEIIEYKEMRE